MLKIKGEISKLALKDDDVIICKMIGALSGEALQGVINLLRETFPNNKTIVYDSNCEMKILTIEEKGERYDTGPK
jgi:hypothetical protein